MKKRLSALCAIAGGLIGCSAEITTPVEEVTVIYRRINPDFPVTAPSGSGPGWTLQLKQLVLSEADNGAANTTTCPIIVPDATEVVCRIGLKTIDGRALARIVGDYTPEAGSVATEIKIPDNGFIQYGEFRGILPDQVGPKSMNGHVAIYTAAWWAELDR